LNIQHPPINLPEGANIAFAEQTALTLNINTFSMHSSASGLQQASSHIYFDREKLSRYMARSDNSAF